MLLPSEPVRDRLLVVVCKAPCDQCSSLHLLVSRDSSNSRAPFGSEENNSLLNFVSLCHLIVQEAHNPLANTIPTALDPHSHDQPEPKGQTGRRRHGRNWTESIYPSPHIASIPKQTTFSPANYRTKAPNCWGKC